MKPFSCVRKFSSGLLGRTARSSGDTFEATDILQFSLQALDVLDDAVDLLVGQLTLISGHTGREALDNFTAGIVDRLSDVIFIHFAGATVGKPSVSSPNALPRGTN